MMIEQTLANPQIVGWVEERNPTSPSSLYKEIDIQCQDLPDERQIVGWVEERNPTSPSSLYKKIDIQCQDLPDERQIVGWVEERNPTSPFDRPHRPWKTMLT
ncbi:hypothetical protein [Scytonema sp. NUACC21]